MKPRLPSRWLITTLGVALGCGGLTACGSPPDPAGIADAAVLATATASNCGCVLYGSHPHRGTATPTVTGTVPTATPTATPTRPSRTCDYCTLGPKPTRTPVAWPTPLVTCTPAPGQPTSTAGPTEASPLFPTFPPNTPLPAVVGSTNPIAVGSFAGEAFPGGTTTNPQTGRPYLIWAQLSPNEPTAGRVYLRTTDPTSGAWLPARSVQGPAYQLAGGIPESAVGVAADGTLSIAYLWGGAGEQIDWRRSTDDGMTWSAPVTLPYAGDPSSYNLRLTVDASGQPHLAAIAKAPGGDPAGGSGDVIYYERRTDGSWRSERRPVDGQGARQFNLALTTLALPDGTIRTVLSWNENQAVYISHKDGPDGAWSAPHQIIDGNTQPYGIPDYLPGGTGHTMQLLAFTAGEQSWVYLFYSLYSTGRICFSASADSGATWSGEDALAYFPIPTGLPPPINGTVHDPVPFYDAGHARVLVVYQYCDRAYPGGGCFPVYAYAAPGTPGRAWTRYADPTHEPLRLFRPALASHSDLLHGTDQHGSGGRSVWLFWREAGDTHEAVMALLDLATFLSEAH